MTLPPFDLIHGPCPDPDLEFNKNPYLHLRLHANVGVTNPDCRFCRGVVIDSGTFPDES